MLHPFEVTGRFNDGESTMSTQIQASVRDDFIVLRGRPSASAFVRLVKTMIADGCLVDEDQAAREWREAREHLRELEVRETGLADQPVLPELPDWMKYLAEEEMRKLAVERFLRYIPYRWALVDLDRTVVFQKTINLGFVKELTTGLPEVPTEEDSLRLCLGQGRKPPAINVIRLPENTYLFSSTSADMRVLEVTPIDPAVVQAHATPGFPSSVLAVFVGFGLNLISGIAVRNRVILVNGSHRAYALRSRGVTHVPCLLGEVSHDDELDLVAPAEVKKNPDWYLKAARPPLFKDYFDPQLRKIVQVQRNNRLLQVHINCQQLASGAL